jgi:hypothetical protein
MARRSLLLQLADGKTSPDMKWAIVMADRSSRKAR